MTGKQKEESETSEYTILAQHIIIATGDETVIPSINGLQEAGFITNVEAVALPTLPHRLAILGVGP